MESKKEAVETILASRRSLLVASKLMEETKLCSVTLLQLQRKQMQLLQQLHLLQTVKISFASSGRRSKKKKTPSYWETVCELAEESVFRKNMSMSRRAFNKLCEHLPRLQRNFKNLSKTITLQKGIAIALYALGSKKEFREIGQMFGVKEAIVLKLILIFCDEVWKNLAPKYLNNFPLTKEKVEASIKEFEALGFPQCMGALGSCSVTIGRSNEFTMQSSVKLLSLVDARCRFIYVSCGSPGQFNNSQIFEKSSLYQYLEQCNLLSELQRTISDINVPVLITGDSTFQLSEKLMIPYPLHSQQAQEQKLFNYVLSKSLKVVKNAFLQLRARFKRLEKGTECGIRNSSAVVLTCCVLHNFLIENNDAVDENWIQTLKNSESKHTKSESTDEPIDLNNDSEAIRLAIASYLSGDDISDNDESDELEDDGESGRFIEDVGAADSNIDEKCEEVFIEGDNGSEIADELMSE